MRSGATAQTAGLLLLLAGFAAGCGSVTPPPATVSVTTSAAAQNSAGSTQSSALPVPARAVSVIKTAIDAVNATAGGAPAAQRAVLRRLVDPARALDLRGCPAAKTTVRFEASWGDLRADPNGAANTYVLPTLIRIYTANRITGTDVTTLLISVSGQRAQLPPLCVS